MEWFYVVLFVSAFSGVFCNTCTPNAGEVTLKIYGVYLIGFSMFFMLMIIILLLVALYLVKHNKTIFGVNINKKFFRQESCPQVTLCNVTSTNDMGDQNKNDGSTLTVNSGIVEIGGLTEPETPIRTDPPREDNKPPMILKKPIRPIQYELPKAQMDDIIKAVLNRQQKSSSASIRELDALSNPGSAKTDTTTEFNFKDDSLTMKDLSPNTVDNPDDCVYANKEMLELEKVKSEVKSKPNAESKFQSLKIPKVRVQNDLVDAPLKVDKSVVPNVEDEQEMYDTLPNPVRCKSTGEESDGYVENIPFYDLLPKEKKSWDKDRRVVLDHDTQYLLPLSKSQSEDPETSCYINANQI